MNFLDLQMCMHSYIEIPCNLVQGSFGSLVFRDVAISVLWIPKDGATCGKTTFKISFTLLWKEMRWKKNSTSNIVRNI